MAQERLSAAKIAPDGYKALRGVEGYIRQCGLEQPQIELVKMRASQINGCAYCLDMHSKDARRGGESEQRLYVLDAWEETWLYTPRERAALAWTEAVTRIADTHAPDGVYSALHPHLHANGVMAFVVSGAIVSQVGDASEQTFHAGQAWWEPPGALRRVSRNASATEPATLLAIYIAPKGAGPAALMKPL
jgi:AhpD family alkylhydroperoxidase